jgi:hypothetical protein
MLAIEYATREFLNRLITIRWEWLLATIILTGKLLKYWLARNAQPLRDAGSYGPEAITRNTERATRNP